MSGCIKLAPVNLKPHILHSYVGFYLFGAGLIDDQKNRAQVSRARVSYATLAKPVSDEQFHKVLLISRLRYERRRRANG